MKKEIGKDMEMETPEAVQAEKAEKAEKAVKAAKAPKADKAPKPAKEKAPRRIVDRRNRTLKTISVFSVLILVAILLIVNIGFDAFLAESTKWDWSSGSIYSLGDVSKEILKDMDAEIRIVGLLDREVAKQSLGDILLLLDEYAAFSAGKVTLEYIDPDRTPGIIAELDPENLLKLQGGQFVVRNDALDKTKVVTQNELYKYESDTSNPFSQPYPVGISAEQAFTGAVKYVTATRTPVVYFSTGQQEESYEENFTVLADLMKYNNLDVKSLDLVTAAEVPDDATLVVMLSPQLDVSPAAAKRLSDYLKGGGRLLVVAGYSNTRFPELNRVLLDYNIEIGGSRVREGNVNSQLGGDAYYYAATVPVSAVSTQAYRAIVRNTRSIIDLKNTKEWIQASTILTTTEEGVAETDGDPEKSSEPGTQVIGMAVENSGFVDGSTVTEPARVLALGSVDLVSDMMLLGLGDISQYNQYFVYTSLNWLAEIGEDSLFIPYKPFPSYYVTQGDATSYWAAAVFVFLLVPAGLLVTAMVVYRRRKNK